MYDVGIELFCLFKSEWKVGEQIPKRGFYLFPKEKNICWGCYKDSEEIAKHLVDNLSFNVSQLGYESIKMYLSINDNGTKISPFILISQEGVSIHSPLEISMLLDIQKYAIKLLRERK